VFLSAFTTSTVQMSRFSLTSHIPYLPPSNRVWFDLGNNIWLGIQIIKIYFNSLLNLYHPKTHMLVCKIYCWMAHTAICWSLCVYLVVIWMSLLSQTRHAICGWRNIEVLSCNHFCNGKTIIIAYCERVFVALVMQPEMHVGHIVVCGLPHCTIFFHIIS